MAAPVQDDRNLTDGTRRYARLWKLLTAPAGRFEITVSYLAGNEAMLPNRAALSAPVGAGGLHSRACCHGLAVPHVRRPDRMRLVRDVPGDEHVLRQNEADRRRSLEYRLRRSRAASHSSARLALRHSHLRRCRAFAGLRGLSADRTLRGYGTTRFLSNETARNGQQAVIAVDIIALMDVLKIEKAVVAGCNWGARKANIIAALWPERCKGHVSVSGYLIGTREVNRMPLPPKAELEWWYQYYFATERGRDGYDKYRRDFSKLIWQLASPKWELDDTTFDRSAAAFDNPDHVSIVIHNYRWRLGLAEGEAKYDELEKRLAAFPTIKVPTITLEGDAQQIARGASV
jgi:pimeloyl-ACP methyl ester carboxylesterase